MATHVFSNFQVPKFLFKKIMQKNLILHFFEMSVFEVEWLNMTIKDTMSTKISFINCMKWIRVMLSVVFEEFKLVCIFLEFFGPASARSYKIGVAGNNWLVGNVVFLKTAIRIFLIFCIKLDDYKGRKVTEPDIWKKLLIWRYSRKRLQIRRKSDTVIFC